MDTIPYSLPAPEQRLEIRFVGSGSEYFRIWIVNLLLIMVTLGLYYPFAKVRRMRYFHAATEVGGHPLSYHADPWKMFRGYILVVVLLGAYSLAGKLSPTAGGVAFLIVAAIWPALWHSSMRFRLHNTGWRGLRARFTGTRGQAYSTMLPLFLPALLMVLYTATQLDPAQRPTQEPGAGFWVLFALVVLALPAQLWWLKRYQHNHYALAGEHTALNTSLGAFYGLFLRALGVVVLGCAAMAAAVVPAMWLARAAQSMALGVLGAVFAFVAALIAFQALMRPYFVVRLQNLLWRGTRSQHLSFDSALRFRSYAWLSVKNWLLVIITLGLYLPFAAVAYARARLEAVTVVSTVDLDQLVTSGVALDESAAGDVAGDFFGIDIGL